ncbi:pentatricopeptide repeat-containing protein At1g18485-like [Typha latifolia]|uniref:pentatricopeptide repeat-containing protein At1g18485-like n=1 Tax=Typha latifolia TaxID=4733 RepID=UPI003C2B1F28
MRISRAHLLAISTTYLHDVILQCRSLPQLKQSHAQAILLGFLHTHLPVFSSLLLSYASFSDLSSSLLLFHQNSLRHSSAFIWNSLSRAFSISGLFFHSLSLYNHMLFAGVRPDHFSFPFAISAATAAKSTHKGLELHGAAVKLGFDSDLFVGNTLLAFYGACGHLSDTRKVFDEMHDRDVVSWNSVISVLSDRGLSLDSMKMLLEMRRTKVAVNSVSLVSVVPACAAMRDEGFGTGVHGLALKSGLDLVVTVGNTFVDMYGKLGDSDAALLFFWSMPERNEISWNSIIGGLVHAAIYQDALRMFRDMLANEVTPNSVTISSLLPMLVELGCFNLGKEVHGYSIKRNMDSDVFVANSLVDMYAKFRYPKMGSDVFERIVSRNVVSWNAMIANLGQNGAEMEAFELVIKMQKSGECPNSVTLTNVLPACARIASLKKGKEIHARSIRTGSIFDLFVSNALIDMYAKCGQLDLARSVFDGLERDDVSYNTLIMGYSQSSSCSRALHLFQEMRSIGIEYDVVSFMGALSACANLSALKQGKEIHCLLIKKMLNNHLFVANSLLDLYTKCGKFSITVKIFDRISEKDVASWNSMIVGYGMQGELETAFNLFEKMKDEGVEYDHVSYVAVLSACSHGGLVEKGKKYFDQMLIENIKPRQMHYACMVDLLGRAGLLTEAEEIIRGMPFDAESDVWGALLGACRIYGNIELARWAAEHLFELKPGHSGYYTLLSNMYAEAGRWDEANEIRGLMKSRKVKKNPGCTWLESDNRVCAFIMGECVDGLETELWCAETC